jgi:D-serine dehydratase
MAGVAEAGVAEEASALADEFAELDRFRAGRGRGLELLPPGGVGGSQAGDDFVGHERVIFGIGMHAVFGEDEIGIGLSLGFDEGIHRPVDVDDVPARFSSASVL